MRTDIVKRDRQNKITDKNTALLVPKQYSCREYSSKPADGLIAFVRDLWVVDQVQAMPPCFGQP